jgi:hypothetical protein
MTLATKNGSIIVKDGKLAENCECCGGWYCYDGESDGQCNCQCPDPTHVLPKVLLFNCTVTLWNDPTVPPRPNPDTSGDIALDLVYGPDELFGRTGCASRTWKTTYNGIEVSVNVSEGGYNSSFFGLGAGMRWYPIGNINGSYGNDLVVSTGLFASGNGLTFMEDICSGRSPSNSVGGPVVNYSYSVRRGD